jgi:hypothetical protein
MRTIQGLNLYLDLGLQGLAGYAAVALRAGPGFGAAASAVTDASRIRLAAGPDLAQVDTPGGAESSPYPYPRRPCCRPGDRNRHAPAWGRGLPPGRRTV